MFLFSLNPITRVPVHNKKNAIKEMKYCLSARWSWRRIKE